MSKNETLKVWNKINAFCRKEKLYRRGDNILLGVSGGPDSMFMLDYFAKMRKIKGIRVFACHLNHGIRGKEADADEKFVRKTCEKLGVPLAAAREDIPARAKKSGKSVEHEARTRRYRFFAKAAAEFNCRIVATAHHMDDNVETILLNLLRGSSPRGLAGIPERRPLSGKRGERVQVIRPLLGVSKKEILSCLESGKIPYRKDRTNEDEKHTRNWIRKKLIPAIESRQPRFGEHLLKLAMTLRPLVRSGTVQRFSRRNCL